METTLKFEDLHFRVSYGGETEYLITRGRFNGRKIRVRREAHVHQIAVDYFPKIYRMVGTVMWGDFKHYHEFPPAEVVDMFPGYVGARWSEDWHVEHDGPWMPPRLRDYDDSDRYPGATYVMPGATARFYRWYEQSFPSSLGAERTRHP